MTPAFRRLAPLLWLGPAIALIGVVVLWPVVVMVQSSFQQIGGEGFVAGYNGTTNYAHGLPIYCVSIGLERDGGTP